MRTKLLRRGESGGRYEWAPSNLRRRRGKGLIPAADEPEVEGVAAQPVAPLQLITRGDPAGRAHVRPLSAELAERGRPAVRARIDICHETVRLWWNRFGPLFAGDIRRQRVSRMRGFRHWRWHLDEMYVKLNGETVYLWRAVDHEGEVLESYVTKS